MNCNRIRLIRQAHRMSLQQLSERLAGTDLPMTKAALSNYETGKSIPSEAALNAIARELGVTLEYFDRPDWDDFSVTLFHAPDMVRARMQELLAYVQVELERCLAVDDALNLTSPFKRGERIPVSSGDELESVCERIRREHGLGEYAISSVCQFLEGEGWCLVLLPTVFSTDIISGVEHSRNLPFIFFAPSPYLDEYRTILLQEYGRTLLSYAPEKETEILSRFARTMLLPRKRVDQEFGESRSSISEHELLVAKQKYGLSRRLVMERLRDCRVITEAYYNTFLQYLNRHSYLQRQSTVSTFLRFFEEPTNYAAHVSRAKAEGALPPDDFVCFSDK